MAPIFYIIMGPNGAGKSTFGSAYTNGIKVYDPDKRKMEIRDFLSELKQEERTTLYPAYTEDMFKEMFDDLVSEYQGIEYEDLRQICINQTTDFALETPFADNFGYNEVQFFKNSGYYIQGIFFGLNTVEQSIANVSIRVKKKGHDLPLKAIEWNFNQCYINLAKDFSLFDNIHFMDAQNPLIEPLLIAEYTGKHLKSISHNCPDWYQRFTDNV